MMDDGVLVRYLDGELTAAEREDVERHADSCVACGVRMEALQRRSEMLGRVLREVDASWVASHPEPRRSARRFTRRHGWLAAAAVLLVLAALSGVSPLRAWVVERSRALWELVAGRSASDAPTAPAGNPQGLLFASVSFVPDTRTLSIEVAERQGTGTLTVESVGTPMASAAIVGGSGTGDLVVLPGRLRIANAASSTASYRVAVPLELEWVEVWVAGKAVVTVRPSEPGQRWEVTLAAPASGRQNLR